MIFPLNFFFETWIVKVVCQKFYLGCIREENLEIKRNMSCFTATKIKQGISFRILNNLHVTKGPLWKYIGNKPCSRFSPRTIKLQIRNKITSGTQAGYKECKRLDFTNYNRKHFGPKGFLFFQV